MVCSRYSAVSTINDCQSGGRGFELVSGTLIFVDLKISGHDSAGCSRALLATLSPSMFFFVLEIKMQIHY